MTTYRSNVTQTLKWFECIPEDFSSLDALRNLDRFFIRRFWKDHFENTTSYIPALENPKKLADTIVRRLISGSAVYRLEFAEFLLINRQIHSAIIDHLWLRFEPQTYRRGLYDDLSKSELKYDLKQSINNQGLNVQVVEKYFKYLSSIVSEEFQIFGLGTVANNATDSIDLKYIWPMQVHFLKFKTESPSKYICFPYISGAYGDEMPHYLLIICDICKGQVNYYDPMQNQSYAKDIEIIVEILNVNTNTNTIKWTLAPALQGLEQGINQCGLYVMHYAKMFLSGQPVETPINVLKFSSEIKRSILSLDKFA